MRTKMKIASLAGILSFAALAVLCPLQALAVDPDGNPPGPVGGPGTNWENPPGHKGGRGASPDRAKWFQRGFGRWLNNHPEYVEKYDANKNGKLDPAEKKEAKKAWKDDRSEKWLEKHPKAKEKWDANKDGVLDDTEKQEAQKHWNERHMWKWRRDPDNNPPGPRGGPGTNWENPRGPKGGKGASPDRQ